MACGAVLGLAWAASMRAMMAEVAATEPGGSHVSIAISALENIRAVLLPIS